MIRLQAKVSLTGPEPSSGELGSGSGALDEAAGVAEATRMKQRRSHVTKMGVCGRKSTRQDAQTSWR